VRPRSTLSSAALLCHHNILEYTCFPSSVASYIISPIHGYLFVSKEAPSSNIELGSMQRIPVLRAKKERRNQLSDWIRPAASPYVSNYDLGVE